MIIHQKWILGSILLSLAALVAFASCESFTAASRPQGNLLTYLPIVAVQRPPWGIYGRLTENGIAARNIPTELLFVNEGNTSIIATLLTDANGEYHYLDVPALAPGQSYYVRYSNPEHNTNHVSGWFGFLITTYEAGAEAPGGDFDIMNIQLTSPDSGAVVGLPITFTWQLRPVPSDSYDFNLYEPITSNPWFYSEQLGYANNYTLESLPDGFQYQTDYVWTIVAYGPGGGNTGNFGFAHPPYSIRFVEQPPLFNP